MAGIAKGRGAAWSSPLAIPAGMANMKEMWDDMESAGARIGGEKRQFRDFQPPDYDPRQRRRTDDAGFPQQQVHPVRACASAVRRC